MLKGISLIGLLIYFAVLLIAVTKEKKNHTVEDYFFAGRTLPFWALSITFIASWWERVQLFPRLTLPLLTDWEHSGTMECLCCSQLF